MQTIFLDLLKNASCNSYLLINDHLILFILLGQFGEDRFQSQAGAVAIHFFGLEGDQSIVRIRHFAVDLQQVVFAPGEVAARKRKYFKT